MFYIVSGKYKWTVTTSHFPDGTLSMCLKDAPAFAEEIQWYYEDDAELFTLICLRNYYNTHNLSLYMPYIPHARMDRVRAPGDVFTLKAFAKIINDMKFSAVTVRDPHSPVAEALFDNIKIEAPYDYIKDAIDSVARLHNISPADVVLFFPDEGAVKRYMNIVPNEYAYGIKNRDWKTGKILNLKVVLPDDVFFKERVCLIIDDICSKGGTFLHAASTLYKYHKVESVNLYVTHLEPTVFSGDMYKNRCVNSIFTTKSIFTKKYLDQDYKNIITILPDNH